MHESEPGDSEIYEALVQVPQTQAAREPASVAHLYRMIDHAESRRAFFDQRRLNIFRFALAILTASLAALLVAARGDSERQHPLILLGLAMLLLTGLVGVLTYFVQSLAYMFKKRGWARSWHFQRNAPCLEGRWFERRWFDTGEIQRKAGEFGEWFFSPDRDDVLECLDLVLTLHIRTRLINRHLRDLRYIVGIGFLVSLLFISVGLALTYFGGMPGH